MDMGTFASHFLHFYFKDFSLSQQNSAAATLCIHVVVHRSGEFCLPCGETHHHDLSQPHPAFGSSLKTAMSIRLKC